MIELEIDGHKVEVEEGASVLDATRKAGSFVPTLCYQRDLSSFGGCRMCIVAIDGVPLWVVPNPSGLNAHETVATLAEAYRAPALEAGVVADT